MDSLNIKILNNCWYIYLTWDLSGADFRVKETSVVSEKLKKYSAGTLTCLGSDLPVSSLTVEQSPFLVPFLSNLKNHFIYAPLESNWSFWNAKMRTYHILFLNHPLTSSKACPTVQTPDSILSQRTVSLLNHSISQPQCHYITSLPKSSYPENKGFHTPLYLRIGCLFEMQIPGPHTQRFKFSTCAPEPEVWVLTALPWLCLRKMYDTFFRFGFKAEFSVGW